MAGRDDERRDDYIQGIKREIDGTTPRHGRCERYVRRACRLAFLRPVSLGCSSTSKRRAAPTNPPTNRHLLRCLRCCRPATFVKAHRVDCRCEGRRWERRNGASVPVPWPEAWVSFLTRRLQAYFPTHPKLDNSVTRFRFLHASSSKSSAPRVAKMASFVGGFGAIEASRGVKRCGSDATFACLVRFAAKT